MKLTFISFSTESTVQVTTNWPKGHRVTQNNSHVLHRGMIVNFNRNLVKIWCPLGIPKVTHLNRTICFLFAFFVHFTIACPKWETTKHFKPHDQNLKYVWELWFKDQKNSSQERSNMRSSYKFSLLTEGFDSKQKTKRSQIVWLKMVYT